MSELELFTKQEMCIHEHYYVQRHRLRDLFTVVDAHYCYFDVFALALSLFLRFPSIWFYFLWRCVFEYM